MLALSDRLGYSVNQTKVPVFTVSKGRRKRPASSWAGGDRGVYEGGGGRSGEPVRASVEFEAQANWTC